MSIFEIVQQRKMTIFPAEWSDDGSSTRVHSFRHFLEHNNCLLLFGFLAHFGERPPPQQFAQNLREDNLLRLIFNGLN
jgi:hypothetical protein